MVPALVPATGTIFGCSAVQQGWLLPGKGTFPAELLFGSEVLQEAAGWILIVRISQILIARRLLIPGFLCILLSGC